jgi:hypothetical protein
MTCTETPEDMHSLSASEVQQVGFCGYMSETARGSENSTYNDLEATNNRLGSSHRPMQPGS